MKIKKILALTLTLVVAIAAFSGCGGNKNNTLIMATEATFPPYEYVEDNEVIGVDVDVAKEIAKELGKELVIENMDFDAIIPAINSGKVDFGAAGMSVTEERKQSVDFSIEYAVSTQVIMTTADSGVTTLEDLFGQSVGVQMGTISDLVLTDDYPDIELLRGKKYTDLAMELKNGNVAAIVLDNLPALAIQAKNPDFTIIDVPVFIDSYAICVKKGNTEMLDAINKVLTRLIEEGKIAEFTTNHLG